MRNLSTCKMPQTAISHKPDQIGRSTRWIHSDVSGIIRQPSHSLFRYFLTFIDDFSRYTHIYLLKSRCEVLEKFIEFQNLVERQLERKIKAFCSDNGTEYTNNAFVGHLKKYGIHAECIHVH